MMIKGEGVLMMKMKERFEWLKQWFQLYKKQLMIGILALIVMFIAGVFAFNYQLKEVFNLPKNLKYFFKIDNLLINVLRIVVLYELS